LHLDNVLEMHDGMCAGVHLLTGKVDLLPGVVQAMLSLTKAAVYDLQLKVLLRKLMCPMTEEGVLTLQPLHHMRGESGLLGVHVQTCTLLDGISLYVVLQVEQVPRVLGHMHGVDVVLQTGDVTHCLMALLPLGLILIPNQEKRKRHISSDGEDVLT
jgi:hypothetical protein